MLLTTKLEWKLSKKNLKVRKGCNIKNLHRLKIKKLYVSQSY